jgi:LmbE family N-acetylglucosaminyl deacetylase
MKQEASIMGKRVLIVAAHPDDEVLGVGGTALKHAENGDEVSVCIMTYGLAFPGDPFIKQLKKNWIYKVSKILNTEIISLPDLPTMELNTLPPTVINQPIEDAINKCKPEIVYTHHRGDVNADHQATFQAVLVAARPTATTSVKRMLAFQTVTSTEWGDPFVATAFIPNYYVNITGDKNKGEDYYIDQKITAFETYITEKRKYEDINPRNPKYLKTIADNWGYAVGVRYAEAFELVRELW